MLKNIDAKIETDLIDVLTLLWKQVRNK